NTLHLWNVSTREMTAEFPMDDDCSGLAFARDGQTLVTLTRRQVILWRIPDGKKLAIYPSEEQHDLDPATNFAATSDLALAAYGTSSGNTVVMDLRDGRTLWSASV